MPENERHMFKHKSGLPPSVMEAVRPTFKALVDTELLKKCLDGYTQNPNESLNSIIWKLCPKNKNHGLQVVETCVAVAICLYNDGASAYNSILSHLGFSSGVHTADFCKVKDQSRVYFAKKRATQASKEYRQLIRRAKKAANEKQEDGAYASGAH